MENLTNFLYNRFQFSQQQQQNILLTEQSISETDLLAGHRATNYLLTPAAHLNLTHHYHFWVAHYVNNNVVGKSDEIIFLKFIFSRYYLCPLFYDVWKERKITWANNFNMHLWSILLFFLKSKGWKIKQNNRNKCNRQRKT